MGIKILKFLNLNCIINLYAVVSITDGKIYSSFDFYNALRLSGNTTEE